MYRKYKEAEVVILVFFSPLYFQAQINVCAFELDGVALCHIIESQIFWVFDSKVQVIDVCIPGPAIEILDRQFRGLFLRLLICHGSVACAGV